MTGIEERKNKLLQDLKALPTADDRFRFLITKAGQLENLSETERNDRFLVKGCISQAWLVPRVENGMVYFKADSEAAIVKGVIAAVVEVYSGSTPDEILTLSPDFLAEGGVSQALSMNRRSGMAGMLKQVRLYALAFKAMASGTPS